MAYSSYWQLWRYAIQIFCVSSMLDWCPSYYLSGFIIMFTLIPLSYRLLPHTDQILWGHWYRPIPTRHGPLYCKTLAPGLPSQWTDHFWNCTAEWDSFYSVIFPSLSPSYALDIITGCSLLCHFSHSLSFTDDFPTNSLQVIFHFGLCFLFVCFFWDL